MNIKYAMVAIAVFVIFPLMLASHDSAYAELYSGISGYVLAEDTGKALPEVKVFIEDENGVILKQVVTNEKGQYIFMNLKAGTYKIGFTHDKYISTKSFLNVTLPKGKNVVNVNYSMLQGSSVAGKIINGVTQEPLRKVRVEITCLNNAPELRKFGGTFSNDNGNYRIDGLPSSEKCIVEASMDGAPIQKKETKLAKGSVTSLDIIFQIDDKTGISGHISTKSGLLPEYFYGIWIKDSNGNDIAYGQSDAPGNYSIKGLLPGIYNITVIWTQPLPNPKNWLHKENVMVETGRITTVNFMFENR